MELELALSDNISEGLLITEDKIDKQEQILPEPISQVITHVLGPLNQTIYFNENQKIPLLFSVKSLEPLILSDGVYDLSSKHSFTDFQALGLESGDQTQELNVCANEWGFEVAFENKTQNLEIGLNLISAEIVSKSSGKSANFKKVIWLYRDKDSPLMNDKSFRSVVQKLRNHQLRLLYKRRKIENQNFKLDRFILDMTPDKYFGLTIERKTGISPNLFSKDRGIMLQKKLTTKPVNDSDKIKIEHKQPSPIKNTFKEEKNNKIAITTPQENINNTISPKKPSERKRVLIKTSNQILLDKNVKPVATDVASANEKIDQVSENQDKKTNLSSNEGPATVNNEVTHHPKQIQTNESIAEGKAITEENKAEETKEDRKEDSKESNLQNDRETQAEHETNKNSGENNEKKLAVANFIKPENVKKRLLNNEVEDKKMIPETRKMNSGFGRSFSEKQDLLINYKNEVLNKKVQNDGQTLIKEEDTEQKSFEQPKILPIKQNIETNEEFVVQNKKPTQPKQSKPKTNKKQAQPQEQVEERQLPPNNEFKSRRNLDFQNFQQIFHQDRSTIPSYLTPKMSPFERREAPYDRDSFRDNFRGDLSRNSFHSDKRHPTMNLTPSKSANILNFNYELMEAWKMRYKYY